MQLPAHVPEKASMIHVGDQNGIPVSRLWPHQAMTVEEFQGVNKQMDDISPSLSLSFPSLYPSVFYVLFCNIFYFYW